MKGACHTGLAILLPLGCALAQSACGLQAMPPTQAPAPRRATTVAAPPRIAQLDFGQRARFAPCAGPACPTATPKTLALSALDNPLPTRPVPPVAPAPETAWPALQPPAAAVPPPVARTTQLVLHFAPGSSRLTRRHRTQLHGTIAALKQADRLVIAGRTDHLGSAASNQTLARQRSQAIRDHLIELAPDLAARIEIDARGRCCYAAPNHSVHGRARNRRVELRFSPPAGGPP